MRADEGAEGVDDERRVLGDDKVRERAGERAPAGNQQRVVLVR